jgi:hypothetical protein
MIPARSWCRVDGLEGLDGFEIFKKPARLLNSGRLGRLGRLFFLIRKGGVSSSVQGWQNVPGTEQHCVRAEMPMQNRAAKSRPSRSSPKIVQAINDLSGSGRLSKPSGVNVKAVQTIRRIPRPISVSRMRPLHPCDLGRPRTLVRENMWRGGVRKSTVSRTSKPDMVSGISSGFSDQNSGGLPGSRPRKWKNTVNDRTDRFRHLALTAREGASMFPVGPSCAAISRERGHATADT